MWQSESFVTLVPSFMHKSADNAVFWRCSSLALHLAYGQHPCTWIEVLPTSVKGCSTQLLFVPRPLTLDRHDSVNNQRECKSLPTSIKLKNIPFTGVAKKPSPNIQRFVMGSNGTPLKWPEPFTLSRSPLILSLGLDQELSQLMRGLLTQCMTVVGFTNGLQGPISNWVPHSLTDSAKL